MTGYPVLNISGYFQSYLRLFQMIRAQKCRQVNRSPYQGNAQYPHQTSTEVESSVGMLLWLVGTQWLGGEMICNYCNCGRFAQRRLAPCKVFYSGFHAVRSGLQALEIVSGISDTLSWIPNFRKAWIPDSASTNLTDSGFHKQEIKIFRIPESGLPYTGQDVAPGLKLTRHLVLLRDITLVELVFHFYDFWETSIDLNIYLLIHVCFLWKLG